jgi:centrin-1
MSKKGPEGDSTKKGGFDPARYSKTGIPVSTISKMKDCFDLFDRDGSGSMSVDELVSGLMALGIQDEALKIVTLVQSISAKRGLSEIDFENFITMFCVSNESQEARFTQMFKLFDKDSKGFVELADFKRVTAELKERYTEPEIELMMAHADKDKDGRLTYDEFEGILRKYLK